MATTLNEKGQTVRVAKRGSLLWWYRQLRKSATATLGVIIILCFVGASVFAPYLAPYDPGKPHLDRRFSAPTLGRDVVHPHFLGTDQLGRDLLSRIIYGSRISLIVGVCAVSIACTIGVAMGLISGFFGGAADTIIMRVVDTILAIPKVMLYVALFGVFGSNLIVLIGILGVLRWTTYARVVRGEVMSLKNREYVEAARAIGQNQLKILLRHILPNVAASIIILATLEIAVVIVVESSMSFLGLGVQPPTVTWGQMLSDGRAYVGSAWWIATFPGIAITTSVLGIIFVGDWLRDVLDPKLRT